MIDVFNAIRAANAALQQGRWDQAADMARTALARDARNAFAMLVLANANRSGAAIATRSTAIERIWRSCQPAPMPTIEWRSVMPASVTSRAR
jgi:hypothetical protein